MITKSDLFEDVAAAIESWTKAASGAMTGSDGDLQWVDAEEPYRAIQRAIGEARVDASAVKSVLSECLRGFAVSFFTTLDGGTALAEKGRVFLVDEMGRRLGEGLHDDFVSYLIDSGRLR